MIIFYLSLLFLQKNHKKAFFYYFFQKKMVREVIFLQKKLIFFKIFNGKNRGCFDLVVEAFDKILPCAKSKCSTTTGKLTGLNSKFN